MYRQVERKYLCHELFPSMDDLPMFTVTKRLIKLSCTCAHILVGKKVGQNGLERLLLKSIQVFRRNKVQKALKLIFHLNSLFLKQIHQFLANISFLNGFIKLLWYVVYIFSLQDACACPLFSKNITSN